MRWLHDISRSPGLYYGMRYLSGGRWEWRIWSSQRIWALTQQYPSPLSFFSSQCPRPIVRLTSRTYLHCSCCCKPCHLISGSRSSWSGRSHSYSGGRFHKIRCWHSCNYVSEMDLPLLTPHLWDGGLVVEHSIGGVDRMVRNNSLSANTSGIVIGENLPLWGWSECSLPCRSPLTCPSQTLWNGSCCPWSTYPCLLCTGHRLMTPGSSWMFLYSYLFDFELLELNNKYQFIK